MPRLHVSDIRMHYERVGKGPPLLITTGWARAERAFLHHRELLADEFDCIRHDHRGIGASDAPDDPYTIEAMADDLAGLLDGLRIPRCRVLGGWHGSTGCDGTRHPPSRQGVGLDAGIAKPEGRQLPA